MVELEIKLPKELKEDRDVVEKRIKELIMFKETIKIVEEIR